MSYESASPRHETLDTITLAEYRNLPSDLKEWLFMSEDVPRRLWDQLSELDSRLTLREVMQKIKDAFIMACDGKKVRATSFEESRFTSFEEIVDRGLDSCGARARVFGTTLRKLGIPVKFIDGKHTEDGRTYDHAWLGIYVPATHRWLESDPGIEETFAHDPRNTRERVFHDWEELEAS